MRKNLENSHGMKDQKFWEKHFVVFKQSGLTRKAYCQDNSLTYDRFQYWYHKLNTSKGENTHLIPVKLKDSISSLGQTLCTLEMKNGARLLIHDQSIVEYLMEEIR